jgi:signal transduction histidine kinase/ligand-binding sensor domain-containing protein/CheY-like chemotaxis protein
MYRIKFYIITTFCLLLISSSLFAQNNLRFKRITTRSGLSQSNVTSIIRDKFGFMWFATRDGLNKFDGYKYTVYQYDSEKRNSISSSYVCIVYEDSKNNIWVGSAAGLDRFDRNTNQFINYPLSSDETYVKSIIEDSNGNMWVGTKSGLYMIDQKTQKVKAFLNDSDNSTYNGYNDVNIIREINKGELWIGTVNGLNILNLKTFSILTLRHKKNNINSILGNNIKGLEKDKTGNIWIASDGGGLSKYNPEKKKFTHFKHQKNNPNSLSTNNLIYLSIDDNDNLWIGTEAGGLNIYNYTKNKFYIYKNNPNDGRTISHNIVRYIYHDPTGITWIGTNSGGISYVTKIADKFTLYKSIAYNNHSLSNNSINSFAEDSKGNIWIATEDGLNMLDPKTGLFNNYKSENSKNSLKDNNIYNISYIGTDSLAIGMLNGGMDILDLKTKKFTNYKHQPGNKNSIGDNRISHIFEDSKKNIWISTWTGGINRFDKKTNKFFHYNLNGVRKRKNITFFSIKEDINNHLWIGSDEGLFKFNPEDETFTQYIHNNNDNQSISNNIINCFVFDKTGNLWIGTGGGGLNYLDLVTKKFTAYNKKNGLSNNFIHAIIEDDFGKLWLSNNKGLTQFDPVTKTAINFGLSDNLQSTEFRKDAAFKAKDGTIYFGGVAGFNAFNPNKIKFNNYIPYVAITNFYIANKPADVGMEGSPLTKDISITTEVNLNYEQSSFSFDFAALNFISPENNQYAYRLIGLDTNWTYADTQRKAIYTNIAPGKYTFIVKASNNDGLWNEVGKSISIHIRPPFWMTWWFRASGILFVLGLVFAYNRFRITTIENQKVELEKSVNERTEVILQQTIKLQQQSEELQTANEELQTQSDELYHQSKNLNILYKELKVQKEQESSARKEAEKANKAKSIFLATMSHEIRTPMNGVLGMASLLCETKLNKEQRDYALTIKSSGESLLNVINDILDFSKIESEKIEIDLYEIYLKKLIEETFNIFKNRTKKINVKLYYNIEKGIPNLIICDGQRLKQVLINLIGNALKFTPQGEICLDIQLKNIIHNDLELIFSVKDTGIGISKNALPNLFEPFSQADSTTTRKYGGTGLGLAISKRLIELMGGKITVKSTPNIGTNFSFNIICSLKALEETNTINLTPKDQKELGVNLNTIFNDNFSKNYPLNILIAEDHIINQKLILKILSKLGYKPSISNNGKECLEELKNNSYDIILMDIQMPEMDGLEATRITRTLKLHHQPIIIALTANAMKEDKEICLKAGMDFYISKPLKIEDLLSVLKKSHQIITSVKV